MKCAHSGRTSPVRFCWEGPEAPARAHSCKVSMAWVVWVVADLGGLPVTAGAVDVFQGGEGAADDPLCCFHNTLEGQPLRYRAAREPHTDAVGENALHRAAVE